MDVDPNLKISELERKLSEEKDRCDRLNSQSELAKSVAIREAENQRRVCLMLRETVARLEEDCKVLRERETRDREIVARLEQDNKTLREREIKDRETIKDLLEEIQQKDITFQEKLVGIELEKKKAEDKVLGWKNQHSLVSKLIDETVAEFGRKKREFVKVAEQYTCSEARSLKTSKENSTLKRKYNVEDNFHLSERAKTIDEDLPKSSVLEMAKSGRVMVDSDSEDYEEDRIPISQLINKRVAEVCEGDKKDPHSSSKCFVTPKPSKFGIHGAEGSCSEEVSKKTSAQIFSFLA
ncbi:uncharacterized protein A4U43_C06F13500 [Asparagus officinalis]|uniref:Uncharacterized protein n=1 Tax=Asparagus officinalis TaxID=4686 RepID=A0A5P1ELP5_ASPOF|nr:uncharacterized protein A4U43_C06F13500 [Asparagus officinalis]